MAVGEVQPAEGYTVAIVGLGLMGGSLAAALRQAWPSVRVLGVARRQETLEQAVHAGYVCDGSLDLQAVLPRADLAVLAVPVRSIVALTSEAVALLPGDGVLTDVGSTKVAVTAAMEGTERPAACLGGHPMCGKETHGIDAADPELYQGATWVLSPGRHTAPETVRAVSRMVRAVGARPLLVDAAEHDKIVARTSHLPYVVAAALARAVASAVSADDIDAMSAGGYRDTTRLAAGDVAVMRDILLTNREPVVTAIHEVICELEEAERRLAQDDEAGLTAYLERARRSRRGK